MDILEDNEYTLIIRYNNKKNSILSDGTIMYSKSSNPFHPTYSQLSKGTPVCIVGSGKLSGVMMFYGTLSKIPEYTQTDQINRFTKPYKSEYENINVWKFSINILDDPFIDITDEPEWNIIKKIISPRLFQT